MIKILRRMLIAQKQGQQVNEDELHRRKEDFFSEIMPVLNQKLQHKEFFVGDQQTFIDLVIFVELETVGALIKAPKK
jgi:glutathione S-transferase